MVNIQHHCYRRLLVAVLFVAAQIIPFPSSTDSYVDRRLALQTRSVRSITRIGWGNGTHGNSNVRIAFRLHDPAGAPRPDRFLSVGAFVCKDRAALPPALGPSREGRLFDFTTTISTDLNILFMGDSLAHQFSQGFDAAVVPEDRDDRRKVHLKYVTGKQFDCLVSTAPVRGGGVTAFWRYTKLTERGRRAPLVPCYMFERWWGENFLQTLLNLEYDPTPETGQRQGSVAGWDAVSRS